MATRKTTKNSKKTVKKGRKTTATRPKTGASTTATKEPGVTFEGGRVVISDQAIIGKVRIAARLNRGKQKRGKKVVSAIVTLSGKGGRQEEGSDMSVDVRC